MRGSDHIQRTLLVAVVALALVSGFGLTAFAADPPVKVTIALTGTPAPGATVTAKATVAITDGSSLQSIKWAQAGGLPVTLNNTTTDTVTVTLPSRLAYKKHLIEILEEPPIPDENYPPHVPVREPYEGGLQNRYGVVAVAPLAAEHTAATELEITVVTSSGTYKTHAEIAAKLPFPHATGIRNVAIGLPVLVHGKTQATYNWALTVPAGSAAKLLDGTTQNPDFTPDIAGTYELTVTDLASNQATKLTIHAGTWKGVITGQDSNKRPVADASCTGCHVKNTPHFDLFTPWASSGHAEVFTQNVNTPNGHYSEACLSCHSVGYDTTVSNGGFDEAPNFAAFVASGLLTHGEALNWTKILSDYPAAARLANIQCENCHGPQDSPAHMKKDDARMTLSSDLCGTCHGEPTRHGRYQQWQLSKHSNYELAREEGTNSTCAKCHSGNGFIQWANNGFSTAALTVDWNLEGVHPVTCQTCHEPHGVGTTSGGPTTNATVRVSGATPKLDAGFTATDVGSAAICMTCHNGRRGLRNDSNFSIADGTRAPHVGPQTDILMGQNMYFTGVGQRGFHAMIQDSCVTCHMESTKPPADLSNNYGGTNHTFYASTDICSKCHTSITAESVQGPIEAKMHALQVEIERAIKATMQAQIRSGNTIDLNKLKTIKSANDIASVEFIESHGRQGVNITLADGTAVNDLSLATVKVVRPTGTSVELYSVADPAIAKAGWNYFMVHSDKSKGVHNPAFVNSALDVALFAVKTVNTVASTPAGNIGAAIGGGLGNGAGAVSCTTPYVYWAEIAGHMPGAAGSQWRTDLVARNLGTSTADLKFVLHEAGGNLQGTGSITGSSQKGFEDIVALMGGANNMGSLEICSNQPLLVMGRIFNKAETGTFGQNIDGHVADLGYSAGQTVNIIGLRQKDGAWRSNISVTNAGGTAAEIAVTLFDANGQSLTTYNLTVPAGQVVQDIEPFRNRANQPNLDWGFATVTVVKGTNVRMLGSLVDVKTNDPTSIPPKQ